MYKHSDSTLGEYRFTQNDFDKLFNLFEEDEATEQPDAAADKDEAAAGD